jgi:hypothetical protein
MSGRHTVQASGRKQDGNGAGVGDRIDLAPVERNHVAGLILDVCPGDKRDATTESFSCPVQHL